METIAAELVDMGAKRDGRGRRLAVRREREAVIAAYEQSGMTQREFAQREGIKFHTFTSWLKRFRQADEKPAFAQVRVAKVTPKSASKAKLTVKLPSGLVVRGTDASQVAELIRLLSC